MRLVALGALALALSGCGGDSTGPFAGLSRSQADERASSALQAATSNGALARRLAEAIQETATGAMGRAGAVELGSVPSLTGEKELSRGSAPQGHDAWVAAYGLAGVGSALSACVYVWDGGSAVDVRESC